MKTIEDIDISGKKVLVRADFNVPLKEKRIADDSRIRASLPTIQRLLDKRARVVLCSHLGRPKGQVVEELRLDPVADCLSELLGKKVKKVDDCVGPEASSAAKELVEGEILLLENTRFHSEEKENDPDFAKQLAGFGEVFVNDAFAAAHRAHASTVGVANYLPSVAGSLMEKELRILAEARDNPDRPLVLILGGAKIPDKIEMIKMFLDKADKILLGGAMANTFLKAQDREVGKSLFDEESLEVAGDLLRKAGDNLSLPQDAVISPELNSEAERRTAGIASIPSDWQIGDIGEKTIEDFRRELHAAKMVIWNGPLGVSEVEPFSRGTLELARYLEDADIKTIIGGGDTTAALSGSGVADRLYHLSTGGGAFLKFMAGSKLPAVSALQEK